MSLRAVLLIALLAPVAQTAQEPTDADLERASQGRTVRLQTGAGGTSRILDVPVELYVARVLAGEGEPHAAAAAQEALAVAIRTFAAANAGRHARDGFGLCDSTHCQVLRPPTPASRLAALATAGQVLTRDGRPAAVFYSASCGGRSEDASQVWAGASDLPYLRFAEDEVHGDDEDWVYEVPLTEVQRILRRRGFEGTRLRGVEVERRSRSGRVVRLRLPGLRPDAIRGEDFRAAVGARSLRSTQFSVAKHGRLLRFTGRGYGHGVGLCVIGAGRRAARGETAAAILQQYYPGLEITGGAAQQSPAIAAAIDESPAVDPRLQRARDLASRARAELSAALGISQPPDVSLAVHPSIDAFRSATGRPWWAAAAVNGGRIELAPIPVLEERDGLETAVRRAVAEVLTAEALVDRPAWVRVGAARYYGTPSQRTGSGRRLKCPSEAELTLPVSPAAHRDAELRAEACFARELRRTGDWRMVR